MTWCIHAAIVLEKRGKPTVTICTNRFEVLAHATASGMRMPNLRLVIVPHPVGSISPDEVKIKADGILDSLIIQLLEK